MPATLLPILTHALKSAGDWRQARDELRARLTEWDPADLLAAGGPPDEYEALLAQLMSRLDAGEEEEDGSSLSAWLASELQRRFGVAPPDIEVFCRRTEKWFHARWPASPAGPR